MRRGTQRAPRRIVERSNGEWEEFDPRVNDYNFDNFYTSGPGFHLPPNVPYVMRKTAVPFKLFVGGIHPSTTEEGIRHIFSNYGHPLSVFRTRNKFLSPIAFVEFETQCEADNAIVELDGKPPLNWEVSYAMPRRSEEISYQQFANFSLDSDFERQTPMFPNYGVGRPPFHSKQSPGHRNTESSMELVCMTNNAVKVPTQQFPPCVVCGTEAPLICTICKTRYCTQACQGRDWPTHQPICRPPPALEQTNPNPDTGAGATQKHAASGNGVVASAREYPNNPKSSTIKGIHPIDKTGASNPRPLDLSVTVCNISNFGSKARTPEMRIVQDISDMAVRYERCRLDGRGLNRREKDTTPEEDTTAEVQPSKGCLRSPNMDNSFASSHSNIRSGTLLVDNQPVSRERQYVNYSAQGAVPKPRNCSMANSSPRTPIKSPNRAPQPQTTMTAKIYATEFSQREFKQPSDKPQKVVVCFAKSPSELYIQYCTMQEVLSKLMGSIASSASYSDPLVNPVEGMPCLALFPDDECWYRAQILKVVQDGIGVKYVDFGNTIKMPNSSESFRMMEHSLSEYPFYAIKVKLADVVPVNGSCWDTDTNRKFNNIVVNETFLMECVQLDANVMSVRLKNQDGSDLVSRLLKENIVKRATLQASDELDLIPSADGNPSLPRLQQLVQKPQQSKSAIQSQLHVSNANASNRTSLFNKSPQASVQAAAPKELASTNLTVPLQTSIQRHSPTRAAFRQDSCVIQPRAPTMPSVLVRPTSLPIRQPVPAVSSTLLTTKALSVIDAIEIGSVVMFQVTVLNGSDRFSGMLVRGEEDMPIFEFSSFAETIEPVPNFMPSVGSIVAVLSSTDSQWYRGCITEVLKSSYNVHYVDFGNEEAVVSVKPIPTSFQHETLSVRLSFVGNLATTTKQYADESMVRDSSHQLEITSKLADGTLLAKFVGENVPTCVVKIESWTSILAEPLASPTPIPEPILEPILDISSPNWEDGFSCDVIPYVAEDVDCIYVQAITDETVELTAKIQKELKQYSPYSVKLTTVPIVGSCVAAIFSDDGDLYRARITDINGEAISVIFVDFGNSSTVSLGEIRVLPDRFYEYPACSKRISLARVERPAGSLPITVQELLANCINKIYKMFVMPSTSELTECTLMQDGEVLNEQIIDCLEQLAINTGNNPPSQMPKLEATPSSDFDIPQEVVPVDNTLSDLSYDDGPFMDLPEDGPFEAVVTCVEGPQLIMMHVADDLISKKLTQLEEQMTAYATAVARGHGPNLSEICIARCPDGKWYRAACLDVIPDPAGNRYMCIQVDYGETHIIDIDEIRRIPRRFIDFMPYLAQHAVLEGTESMQEVKLDVVTRFGDILPKNSKVIVSVVSRAELTYIVRIPEVSDLLSAEGLF